MMISPLKMLAFWAVSALLFCGFSAPSFAFRLPDTGQTKCYDTEGKEMSCTGTGQDGAYSNNPMSFTDNNDGTVTDNNTGLIWQKLKLNNWENNWYQASGTYDAAYNPTSQDVCGDMTLGGHDDWRLPTLQELHSIVDYGSLRPAINTAYFPDTEMANYWSSTVMAIAPSEAWHIYFGSGGYYGYDKFGYNFVRCVRGTQAYSFGGFIMLGRDFVLDTRTGLTWQRKESATMDWASALQNCENLSSGGHTDWRLPHLRELMTLVDFTRLSPSIDRTFFTDATKNLYWSSTTDQEMPRIASGVDFVAGYASGGKKVDAHYVRCVRGGETGSLDNMIMLIISRGGTGDGTVTGSPGGISCGDGCSAVFPTPGSAVTLTAAPDDKSVFSGWSGEGCAGTGTCTTTVSGIANVKANFTRQRTLTVVKSGTGGGLVSASPAGISCGEQCTYKYLQGDVVTLTAIPDAASSFSNWAGCDVVSGTSCTLTLNSEKSVIAYFMGKTYSILSLDLSSLAILQNALLSASGKLTPLPEVTGRDLSNIPITLGITAPDGAILTQTTTTYDVHGHYKFENLGGFTQKGSYRMQASFGGSPDIAATTSEARNVLVGTSAGYAILVEGKITNSEGLESHNKTANRIYGKLKDRGFADDNIYYFNFSKGQPGVDDTPAKAKIQAAIETWAKERMNGSPAPLYIILIDHGGVGKFYIENEIITPSDLDAWLTSLDVGLNAQAQQEKKVVIIGACYSGSFIAAASRPGRVIITSAAQDEESYKGPSEPDGVRSGEFFLEEFFTELWKGVSIGKSFESAAAKTRIFTRRGEGASNTAGRYNDKSVQHPLLDDDGNGRGSNILPANTGDGGVAAGLYLGTGVTYSTNAAGNPADIMAVTGTLFLDPATSAAALWAKANDDGHVSSAWVEVRAPSVLLTGQAGSDQLVLDIPKGLMTLNGYTSKWEKTYSSFEESGKYEIFYYVRDAATSTISPMKRSVVYKNRVDNGVPAAFGLKSPADGSSDQGTVLVLQWEGSSDSDGLTYTLMISRDKSFASIDYIKEEIMYETTAVGREAGLQDLTTYYWKVLAIDAYGAIRQSSKVWSFSTNNTNGLVSIVTGYVTNGVTGSALPSATVKLSATDSGIPVLDDGFYFTKVEAGSIAVSAEAPGYGTQVIEASPAPGEVLEMNFNLTPANPCAATLGDDLSLHIPVVDAGGVYLWVDLIYDPARTDAVVFELKTGYGLLTDVAAFSSCQPATFGSGDGGATWKLSIPEIFFGTMKLWADMVLETGGGSRILLDVTKAEIM